MNAKYVNCCTDTFIDLQAQEEASGFKREHSAVQN